jgi:multiple sugar transport system permease protein
MTERRGETVDDPSSRALGSVASAATLSGGGRPAADLRQGGPGGLLARLGRRFDRKFFLIAVLPAFLVVFFITVVPFVSGVGLSFSSVTTTSNKILPLTLGNYRDLFSDAEIATVLLNTLIYVGLAVVIETVVGLLLAVLLAQDIPGITIFRIVFLLPLMVAGVVSATSWSALFNVTQGWIDWFLGVIHLPQPDWLGSPSFSMPAVVVADMWSGVPVVAVIVLAALLAAPQEPIEAAYVDGATPWQRFRYIVFPAIRPVVMFAALLRTVAGFQQFGLFQIMTGGGPGLSTSVFNYYVYQESFVYNNIAYGAALAVVLMLLMIVPLAVLFALSQRR